jgi:hypothetical protein
MSEKKKHFKHHEDEMWDRLSQELGGEFIDRKGWRFDKIKVRDGEWTITIDLHSHAGYKSETLFTRIRVPFVNEEGLHFKIFHQGFLDTIGAKLGVQDIIIGVEEFDKTFMIQGDDEEKIRALLSSEDLRADMLSEPKIHLTLRDSGDAFSEEFPDGVDELVLEIENEVTEKKRLRKLYDIVARTLHHLCHHDSAYHRFTDG